MRAEAHDRVEGLLFSGLNEETLFEVDAYESDLYDRIPVIVATAHGPVDGTAYVIPKSHRQALTQEPWDAEWFREHQLAKYLNG